MGVRRVGRSEVLEPDNFGDPIDLRRVSHVLAAAEAVAADAGASDPDGYRFGLTNLRVDAGVVLATSRAPTVVVPGSNLNLADLLGWLARRVGLLGAIVSGYEANPAAEPPAPFAAAVEAEARRVARRVGRGLRGVA